MNVYNIHDLVDSDKKDNNSVDFSPFICLQSGRKF